MRIHLPSHSSKQNNFGGVPQLLAKTRRLHGGVKTHVFTTPTNPNPVFVRFYAKRQWWIEKKQSTLVKKPSICEKKKFFFRKQKKKQNKNNFVFSLSQKKKNFPSFDSSRSFLDGNVTPIKKKKSQLGTIPWHHHNMLVSVNVNFQTAFHVTWIHFEFLQVRLVCLFLNSPALHQKCSNKKPVRL